MIINNKKKLSLSLYWDSYEIVVTRTGKTLDIFPFQVMSAEKPL